MSRRKGPAKGGSKRAALGNAKKIQDAEDELNDLLENYTTAPDDAEKERARRQLMQAWNGAEQMIKEINASTLIPDDMDGTKEALQSFIESGEESGVDEIVKGVKELRARFNTRYPDYQIMDSSPTIEPPVTTTTTTTTGGAAASSSGLASSSSSSAAAAAAPAPVNPSARATFSATLGATRAQVLGALNAAPADRVAIVWAGLRPQMDTLRLAMVTAIETAPAGEIRAIVDDLVDAEIRITVFAGSKMSAAELAEFKAVIRRDHPKFAAKKGIAEFVRERGATPWPKTETLPLADEIIGGEFTMSDDDDDDDE
jgi:hypothetical protein